MLNRSSVPHDAGLGGPPITVSQIEPRPHCLMDLQGPPSDSTPLPSANSAEPATIFKHLVTGVQIQDQEVMLPSRTIPGVGLFPTHISRVYQVWCGLRRVSLESGGIVQILHYQRNCRAEQSRHTDVEDHTSNKNRA